MKCAAVGVVLLAVLALSHGRKSYRGHQIISVQAENKEQLKVLHQLQDDTELLFLGHPNKVRQTEVVVPPQAMVTVLKALRTHGMDVSLLSADLQAEIDAVMEENTINTMKNNQTSRSHDGRYSPPHNVYRQIDEVESVLLELSEAYPTLAHRRPLSRHSELGREVFYLELGTAGNDKPVIFIEGLAHAREWIVTAALLYSMDKMLSGYQSGDQRAVDALTRYTWVIIPVVNPDGYEYSWTHNRMWRKNRKFISGTCSGVDLNRNFDVQFGGVGTSSRCRDDIYHGGSPFSEAETQNVATLFQAYYDRVVSFLSVHAYSQLLLHPWAYSTDASNPPANIDQLMDLARKMQIALGINGKDYRLGTPNDLLGYAAAGGSFDWALTAKPGIYAYCYELRPASSWEGGFEIPPSEIVPTGRELLESLYVVAENMVLA